MAAAPYDRHLYPNYLGNNPGNQGRNYSGTEFIANPFVGTNGSTDKYLMLLATTGKDPAEVNSPEKKLSAYLSVIPVAQTPPATTTGGGTGTGTGGGSGSGTGGGSGSGSDTTGTGEQDTMEDPGAAMGGCSTTGSKSGGLVTFLLLGMAAIVRRRGRK